MQPALRVPLGFLSDTEAQEYWGLIYLGGTMNLGIYPGRLSEHAGGW